jgi:hypothetical protein
MLRLAQSGSSATNPIQAFDQQNAAATIVPTLSSLDGTPTGYASYVVASIGGQISPFILGGSYSTSFLWDPSGSNVLQYWSVSIGPGIGLSAGGGLQVGVIGLNSPSDFTGIGIQVSGFAAWETGVAGTAVGGTGNLGLPGGATYSGATGGVVTGAGASAAAEVTYTRFIGSTNFSQLPQNVQAAFCKAVGC